MSIKVLYTFPKSFICLPPQKQISGYASGTRCCRIRKRDL